MACMDPGERASVERTWDLDRERWTMGHHLCRPRWAPIRANLRPRLLGHSEHGALAHGLLRLAIRLSLFLGSP